MIFIESPADTVVVETKERRDIYVISAGGSDQVYTGREMELKEEEDVPLRIFFKKCTFPHPSSSHRRTHVSAGHMYITETTGI
jgi:hypothetical protein